MASEIKNDSEKKEVTVSDSGGIILDNAEHRICCLTIIGHIEGHYILSDDKKTTKYEHIIPVIAAVEQDTLTEGVLIIINTAGGDVEAGLAIAEMIAGMSKPTVSLVAGGSHSIGVPLAVSADYSFIVPSASMTIHPVRLNGLVLGVPQSFDYFEKIQERITNFVVSNSGIDEKTFRNYLMNTTELVLDVGTVLSGKQAVESGLINSIGGLHDALEKLYCLIENKD